MKQLENLTLTGEKQYAEAFLESLQSSVQKATELRRQLEATPANDVESVKVRRTCNRMRTIDGQMHAAADLLISDAFSGEDTGLLMVVARFRDATPESLQARPTRNGCQKTFHWPLEFPEVFMHRAGSIPGLQSPVSWRQKITGNFGTAYRIIWWNIWPEVSGQC